MLFAAWLAISRADVWVLVIAQVVIFQPFVSGVVAVVDGDVVVAGGGSGCKTRGCRVCRGAVG